MTDVKNGEVSMGPSLSHDISSPAHVDEDLIDYDSDDASAAVSAPKHGYQHGYQRDSGTSGAAHEAPDVDLNSPAANDLVSLEATHPESPNGHDSHMPHDITDVHNEGDMPAPENSVSLPGEGQEDYHEIDYDHDDVDYGTHNGNDHQSASVSQRHDTSSEEAPAASETEAQEDDQQFEIDWEEDMAADEHANLDPVTQDAVEHEARDEDGLAIQGGDDASAKDAHQGSGSHEMLDQETQEIARFEGFPDIVVWYREKEYPFFAQSSDGFFGDVSVLDDSMGTVLAELRIMLEAEINEQDELVFQIDKLGLEFSESSPDEALSTITLRKVLTLMNVLAKNEDPESYGQLFTYLSTRPNTMRRFNSLLQSATVEHKGLGEVLYIYGTPADGRQTVSDDAEEYLGDVLERYESFDEDDAFDGGNEQPAAGEEDDSYNSPGSAQLADGRDTQDGMGFDAESKGLSNQEDLIGGSEKTAADVNAQQNHEGEVQADSNGQEQNSGETSAAETASHDDEDLIDYLDDPDATYDTSVEDPSIGMEAAQLGVVTSLHMEDDIIDYADDQSNVGSSLVDNPDDVVQASTEGAETGVEVGPPSQAQQSAGANEESKDGQSDRCPEASGGMPNYNTARADVLRLEEDLIEYSDKDDGENDEVLEEIDTAQQDGGCVGGGSPDHIATNEMAGERAKTDGELEPELEPEHVDSEARRAHDAPEMSTTAAGETPASLDEGRSPSFHLLDLEEAAGVAANEVVEAEGEAAVLMDTEASALDLSASQVDLLEIDWTAGAGEDMGGHVEDTQSTAMKRNLPDAEEHDGNDVKRRRS